MNTTIEEFLNFPVEIEPYNQLLPLDEIIVQVTTAPVKSISYLVEGSVDINE